MGLNKLFRRLTENRLVNSEKTYKKQNSCKFIVGDDLEFFNSNPDLPQYCKKQSCVSPTKKATTIYPSCPSLNLPSPATTNNNNTLSNGIDSCCSSSSSSSLIIHQQERTSASKHLTPFLKLKRSATAIRQNHSSEYQKKRSWILSSSHTTSCLSSSCSSTPPVTKIQLPDNLFLKCIDHIDDPFELCRLKSINSSVYKHIQQRLEHVVEMDVRKIKFDSIDFPLSAHSSQSSMKLFIDGQIWYSHPLGYKVLMRFTDSGQRVEILVDDSWTSKDVVLLCSIMDVFRLTLKRISLDAPIFELAIASLSIMDLDRWYAFQCFMKAVNDFQIHLSVTKHPQSSRVEDLYWPNAEALVIRTTEHDSAHLSRIFDYGVRSQLVMDRKRLNVLKIILTDVEKMNRNLIRNLYHFRCWAGSAGFDDRFSQQYCVNVV